MTLAYRMMPVRAYFVNRVLPESFEIYSSRYVRITEFIHVLVTIHFIFIFQFFGFGLVACFIERFRKAQL